MEEELMGLITAQEVVTNTSMGGNVDKDNYSHLIDVAETTIAEPVLGSTLYRKIITDFNEGGANNLTGDYLEMFNNYIKPIIWHSVYAMYLRDANVLAKNGGIFEHSKEDGRVASIDNIKYVSKQAQGIADVYIQRLEKYLCEKNIAEYDNNQTNDYDVDPNNVRTISGWHL